MGDSALGFFPSHYPSFCLLSFTLSKINNFFKRKKDWGITWDPTVSRHVGEDLPSLRESYAIPHPCPDFPHIWNKKLNTLGGEEGQQTLASSGEGILMLWRRQKEKPFTSESTTEEDPISHPNTTRKRTESPPHPPCEFCCRNKIECAKRGMGINLEKLPPQRLRHTEAASDWG